MHSGLSDCTHLKIKLSNLFLLCESFFLPLFTNYGMFGGCLPKRISLSLQPICSTYFDVAEILRTHGSYLEELENASIFDKGTAVSNLQYIFLRDLTMPERGIPWGSKFLAQQWVILMSGPFLQAGRCDGISLKDGAIMHTKVRGNLQGTEDTV